MMSEKRSILNEIKEDLKIALIIVPFVYALTIFEIVDVRISIFCAGLIGGIYKYIKYTKKGEK